MAKFSYSMENILRIKEKIEEQKRMELGQAMTAYQKEVDQKKRLESVLEETIDTFRRKQKERLVVLEFQLLSQNVAFYEEEIKNQKIVIEKALKVVEIKRTELRKALEEKKIQEKLKENALEAFLEEEKIKEQNLLDEIVSFRYQSDDSI